MKVSIIEPRAYGQILVPLPNSVTHFHVSGRWNISGSTAFILLGIKGTF